MNLLTDPDFELGTSWAYSGLAVRSTQFPRLGSYSVKMSSAVGLPSGNGVSGIISEYVLTTAGSTYQFSVWLYHFVTSSDPTWRFTIKIEEGAGAGAVITEVASLAESDLAAFVWGEFGPYEWTATQALARIRIDTSALGIPVGLAQWFVDSAFLGDVEMAFTKSIRDKLILDLADIDGTGIFSTTLDAVYSEPVPEEKITGPAVWLFPSSGGQGELGTITSRKGIAEQFWTIKLMVRSDTPHDDTMDLIDDVRNSVERSTSNLQGLAGVEEATVTGWTEVLTSEDIRKQYGKAEITVRVAYIYTRGAA